MSRSAKNRLISSTCISAAMMAMALGSAYANPQDGVVTSGSANISSSGTTLNIHQSTERAVIDWRSFDIGASETTRFYQPSSSSVTLNRVNSATPSFIDGSLIANGNIFIVNQNGVLFGANSRVDVNGLVASTADIDTANFMAGDFRFDRAGHANAVIENRGTITAGEAGLVGLVAPNVLNSGIIHAKLGRVHLASGDTATVDLYGDGLMEVAAGDYSDQRVVENTGKITSEGGTIALTASAGAHMVNNLIRVSGELHAPAVGIKNGKIVISAGGSNAVQGNVIANKGNKTGTSKVVIEEAVLDVSGLNPGERGGTIEITADQISLLDSVTLDARGFEGGGAVFVGGSSPSVEAQPQSGIPYGADFSLPAALETFVSAGTVINASATGAGDGGHVVVYADKKTEFLGTIIADAAGDDGNGGFAEISSHDLLSAYGAVHLRAGRRGRAGTWLLDPADITITDATDTNNTGNPNYTATGAGSEVSASSIVANLNAGTNVTILTTNDAHAGNGDIFVNGAITATGSGSLTLSAYRNITVSSAITLNGGSVTLRADNTGGGSGAINVTAAISTTGGNIVMGGGSGAITAGSGYATGNAALVSGIATSANISAAGGNIIMNGRGANISGNSNNGISVASGVISTTGSGSISMNGIGQGTVNSSTSSGITIYGGSNVLTANGDITLTGTGGGAGTGSSNFGVVVSNGGTLVRATGTGNLVISGTGGNGSGSGNSNYGVYVTTGATGLRTNTGNMTITGTGSNASGGSNAGMILGFLSTSGGNVSLTGTGGASTGNSNYGVSIHGSIGVGGTAATVSVSGTGGGSGSSANNYGVYLTNSVTMTTAAGNMTITGVGGAGGGIDNIGIRGDSASTVQTTGAGILTLTGTSNSTGGNGKGIYLSGGGIYRTTGSGNIVVNGAGSTISTSGYNIGIQLGATVASQGTGSITVTGTGGGSGSGSSNSYGLLLQSGGLQTVSGTLNVSGFGGGGASGTINDGINITSANSSSANVIRSTGSGAVIIRAVKGAGTAGYGVDSNITDAITTTGTGNITVYADTLSLGASNVLNSIGVLTLAPYTNASMGVGYASGYTLNLDATTLGNLNGASYVFGALVAGNGTSSTGDVAVSTTKDFSTKNVTFISGNDIALNGTLTKATGAGSAAYIFRANRNIYNTGSAAITATTGSINLTLQSDYDGNSDGAVYLNGGSVSTNGGDIIIGGGAGAVTAGNGFAYGNATYARGVYIGAALSAAGGNIVINGASVLATASDTYGIQTVSAITTTGAGTISINGVSRASSGNISRGYGTYLQAAVTAVNGNITLSGTGGGWGTGSDNYGMVFSSSGGYARSTGSGNIIVSGTGGVGSGGSNIGVLINFLNAMQSSGTGTITVNGTGGVSSGTTNAGIIVGSGAAGSIASAGGAITITGTGGNGSGWASVGVIVGGVAGASVTNTGSGTITINGTGAGISGSGSDHGVYINNGAIVSTVDGALNMTGTGGGNGAGSASYGVIVGNTGASIVRTTGTGTVSITGTGGNGSGSSLNNHGILINATNTVQATGTGGVTLNGTGSTSSGGSSVGVNILGTVSAAGGLINITGAGGLNSGNSNDGIRVSGGTVSNTGTGSITMSGTGGGTGASGSNYGAWIVNAGTVSTVNGAVTITGTGGASTGGSNHGIGVTSAGASTVRTTGSGSITLNGGTTSGSSNGLNLLGVTNGVQTTGTGNIRLYTNSLSMNTASTVNSIGSLTISALTPGLTMGVGAGAGTFAVSDALLGYTTANSYIFGATNLGDMAINTGFDFANKNVTFLSGGNITLAGTLTKATGAGTASYILQANGNVTNSGSAGVTASSGAINLTITSDNDINASGTISLANIGLLTNNGTITLNSNGQSAALSGTIGGTTTINSANGAVTAGAIDGTTVGTKDLIVNTGTGTFTTTGAIGATNRLRDLTINADDVVIGHALNGSGALTLQKNTAARDIYVARGVADGSNLNISTAEIGYFVDGWGSINIGNSAGSSSLYIGASTWVDPISFRNNFRVDMSGALTATGNASVDFTIGNSGWLNQNVITTAGQNVTLTGIASITGAHTITTNGGNISVATVMVNSSNGSPVWSTSGGNITISGSISRNAAGGATAGRTFTLDAGTGAVSIAGTVNGDHNFAVTAASLSTPGAWGGSEALGDITLNLANSLTLPAITMMAGKTLSATVTGAGNTITTTGAIAVGTGGNITFTADDLALGGNLSGTGILTLQPYSASRVVRLTGTGDFNLSAAELGYFVNGWNTINIGRTDSTQRNFIGQGASIAFQDNVVLRQTAASQYNAITLSDGASLSITGNTDFYGTVTSNGGSVSVGGRAYGGNATLTTNGGAVTLGELATWDANTGMTVNSGGGNITITGIVTQAGTPSGARAFALNAGTGTISFGSTVNTNADITATATSILFNGAWGGTATLGNVSLTSTNALSLPEITTTAGKTVTVNVTGAGNAITTTGAISTGTAGSISLTSDDIVLGGNLSGTGTLTLQQSATNRALFVNYGTANGTNYNLSTAEMAYFVNGWSQINVGKTSTTVTNYQGVSSWVDPVTFRSASGRQVYGVTGTDNSSISFSGASSWVDIYGDIATSGGAIDFSGANYIWLATNGATTRNITSSGGNISFKRIFLNTRDLVVNAGTGAVSISSAVDETRDITITGNAITLGTAWGGSAVVGNVSLNSVNSISMPGITTAAGKTVTVNVSGAGNSITTTGAISTGAGGNIALTADDLALGGNLSGTGSLTLQPYANNRVMRINYGTSDGTNLHLSTAELGYFVDGWSGIYLGKATGGSAYMDLGASTWLDPVYFRGWYNRVYNAVAGTGNSSLNFNGTSTELNATGTVVSTQGQAISFLRGIQMYVSGSSPTINSNGGNITIGQTIQVITPSFGTFSALSGGGNITLGDATGAVSAGTLTSGGYVFDAGAGSLTFNGTVNTAGNVTASGSTVTLNHTWGGTTPLGNISLTAVNSMLLPTMSAARITAVTTGVAADLTIGAGKTLTASGSGNAITLAAGRNLINSSGSATPLVLTGAGRWLTYSTNPGNDTLGGMTADFVRYGCTYGGSCPSGVTVPAAGNGTIYTYRPTLTLTPTAVALLYGAATPAMSGYAYTASGYLTGAAGDESSIDSLTGSLTGTTSYSQGSDIGSYYINYGSGSVASALGYQLAYANNASAIAVGKRTLNVSLTGSIDKVYDGNDSAAIAAANYALSNFYGADAATVSISNTSGLYDDKNAGTNKTVTVSGLALTGAKSGNYQLSTTNVNANIGNISKKSLGIAGLAGVDRVYNGTDVAGLSGTAVLSGDVAGDDIFISTLGTGQFADRNAGLAKTITVTGFAVSGVDVNNYILSQPTGLTADIAKKSLVVTASDQNVTYGTSVPAAIVSYNGFISGEGIADLSAAPTVTSANSGIINAGTYTNNYAVSGGAATNYSLSYVNGTLTVNKKTLNVTADGSTVTYGTNAPAASTISYNGFISGEDDTYLSVAPTAVSTLSGRQNAGTYAGNYIVSGGVSDNYAFNYFNGDLVVSKQNLAVSADNKSVSYGTAVPTGSLTYSGFVSGEDETFLDVLPTVNSTLSGVQNAGTYAGNYVVSGGADGNYNLVFSNGSLSVTAVGVNVIVNNRNVIYGTAVPATTLTYSGFVNGDTDSILTTTPTITSANSGIVNVGTYAGNYTASGAAAANYVFNYVAGDLTVNKKVLNVTAGNRTITYGDAIPLPALTYTGFITGEDATSLSTAPTVASSQTGVVDVGTYVGNYVASGGASGNYAFNYVDGNLNVVKKVLTVTADSRTIAEGATIPSSSTITYSGFVNSETDLVLDTQPTVTSVMSGIPGAGVYTGNYLPGGALDNNYAFTYVAGNLIVVGSVVTPPPTAVNQNPPVTTSTLPSTFVYTSQKPVLAMPAYNQIAVPVYVTYEIGQPSDGGRSSGDDEGGDDGSLAVPQARDRQTGGSAFVIEITPELAEMLELNSEDLQRLNPSTGY